MYIMHQGHQGGAVCGPAKYDVAVTNYWCQVGEGGRTAHQHPGQDPACYATVGMEDDGDRTRVSIVQYMDIQTILGRKVA